jgi:hypothetical protein
VIPNRPRPPATSIPGPGTCRACRFDHEGDKCPDNAERARLIARGLVERYLKAQGGDEDGFTFDRHEEVLTERIARALVVQARRR